MNESKSRNGVVNLGELLVNNSQLADRLEMLAKLYAPDAETPTAMLLAAQRLRKTVSEQQQRKQPDNAGDSDRWEDPRDTSGGKTDSAALPDCKCLFCGRVWPSAEYKRVCPVCENSADPRVPVPAEMKVYTKEDAEELCALAIDGYKRAQKFVAIKRHEALYAAAKDLHDYLHANVPDTIDISTGSQLAGHGVTTRLQALHDALYERPDSTKKNTSL